MQSLSNERSALALIGQWPKSARLATCAVLFPTLGFLAGAIVSTFFMNVSQPVTTLEWILFACPTSMAATTAIASGRVRLGLIGLAPQPLILVGICFLNHATVHQVRAFWPVVFPALVGPGVGLWVTHLAYQAIENSIQDS